MADEYGTLKIEGSHGEKGARLAYRLSCCAIPSASRRRKRDETYVGHPAKRFATEPSQFVEALAKYASD